MKDYIKLTLDQLRLLPGYTSGSSCNQSLQHDIDSLYRELDAFSEFYDSMTQTQLCTYLRDMADDLEYYNIPQMRQIQAENYLSDQRTF